MGKHPLLELSVFFPAYNEEANIKNTIEKAIPVIKEVAKKWEVVVVNDGSTDKTEPIVKQIMKEHPEVRMITHSPNRGYGAAFKSGFYNSKFQWITFTDADGQFDFQDIYRLIEKQKQTKADLVIGYYLGRKAPFVRIWGSRLWELMVLFLFGLKVKDIDCGFKLVSKKVIDTIPKLESERGPFISSEFLIKAKKAGFKIEQVGVAHFARRAGKASGAKFEVILAGFKDLFGLWFKMNLGK